MPLHAQQSVCVSVASPLGRGEDEGEGFRNLFKRYTITNPHPALSLKKGEAIHAHSVLTTRDTKWRLISLPHSNQLVFCNCGSGHA